MSLNQVNERCRRKMSQNNKLDLIIDVIEAKNLTAKDKNGTSDPYAVVQFGTFRRKTKVIGKCLNPVWKQPFRIPIERIVSRKKYLSRFDRIDITVWDKDYIGSEYLGHIVIPLCDLCPNLNSPEASYEHLYYEKAEPLWYPLEDDQTMQSHITGEICLKMGWSNPKVPYSITFFFEYLWSMTSSTVPDTLSAQPLWTHLDGMQDMPRDSSSTSVDDEFDNLAFERITTDAAVTETTQQISQLKADLAVDITKSDSLCAPSIIMENFGLLTVEIVGARNLPRLKSLVPRRFDMDPFVVASFGMKTFKTRFIRHNLNPVWNQKFFFNVKHLETNYGLKFTVCDHERITQNEVVGTVSIELSDLIAKFLSPDSANMNSQEFVSKELPLNVALESEKATHKPILSIKVNFKDYVSLRRAFWKFLAEQFDNDGNSRINHIELGAILETVGSVVNNDVLPQFFKLCGKTVDEELTIDEFERSMERETVSGRFRLVFDIKRCPFCMHKLVRKGTLNMDELGVITHMAVCTNRDAGSQVERFLLGGFLTEENAQRRWVGRIATYISFGSYKVGRNNGNILICERSTGLLLEEKMPTYIRLGIRLLYQSVASKEAVDTKLIRKLLRDMTEKQGKKFSRPASKRQIWPFIKFHKLNVDEILLKDSDKDVDSKTDSTDMDGSSDSGQGVTQEILLNSFNNFNEFFYRKLKPDARKVDAPSDPFVVVSPSDCRCNVFDSIDLAKKLWIKGEQFSVKDLLQDEEMANYYSGGKLAIMRLAPQDYHRFHHPVDGVVGKSKQIQGAFYTVNPMAIRAKHLTVFTENARMITYIQSDHFGTVAYCCIGAMMVGSVILTDKEGQRVSRFEEHGYFAFGGSTIILLFPKSPLDDKKSLVWDSDLMKNSQEQIETLIKVGNHIGRLQ